MTSMLKAFAYTQWIHTVIPFLRHQLKLLVIKFLWYGNTVASHFLMVQVFELYIKARRVQKVDL